MSSSKIFRSTTYLLLAIYVPVSFAKLPFGNVILSDEISFAEILTIFIFVWFNYKISILIIQYAKQQSIEIFFIILFFWILIIFLEIFIIIKMI